MIGYASTLQCYRISERLAFEYTSAASTFMAAHLWAGHYILQLWFLSLFLPLYSFFFAYSQRSDIGYLPYVHTRCGLSANLECMSEIC